MKLLLALGTAALLLASLPAAASPLDDAKQAGHVGEQADGYIGMPPGAPGSAQDLVEQINAARGARYAEIAAKNETSASAVAALAGNKLVGRAPAGQWVRDASGKWQRK